MPRRHTDASDEPSKGMISDKYNMIPQSLVLRKGKKNRPKGGGDVGCLGKQHELYYKRKSHINNKEKMLFERELELIQLLLKRSDC